MISIILDGMAAIDWGAVLTNIYQSHEDL